jgi:hypothetical protein
MHSPLPVLGRGEPERYESPAQVASDLNVSLLGALARSESEWTPPLVLPDLIDPEAPYDAVADRIELLAGQMPLKLLGCIGLGDDPLRYRLAANLAARLARTGARVTLVEAELHAPLLQADKNRREGLVDMLLYGCSFAAVARESGIPGVKVVGAGSHLWSGEPIHGDEWERVLGALRAGSDFTLVTTTTGLPAPILGMLIRRLDSIVIAYALERASREAVRRSYLALWDMDAPILGLVTEGPHLAGTARAAADRTAAPPAPRKSPEAPPQIGADWASRLLGEPLAPGLSPMTEEVEVVIRQTSEVDAAAAALWEKEVERLRSILTAPDGVAPFLDAEAPPPTAESDESAFDSAWALDDEAPAPAIPAADEPPIASGAEPSADAIIGADPIAELARDPAPAENEPAPRPAGAVQDWGAAIGAEIAAWGTAGPADESRPSTKLQGLERITIVAEDTFFAASRAAENPADRDQGSGLQPPANVPSDSVAEEPADAIGDATDEAHWMPPPAPSVMGSAFAQPPVPPVPPVPPRVPFADETTPPVPPSGPRSDVSSAAEEAASWFARLDGALPSTPPAPPIPETPLPAVPPLNLGRPPVEDSAPPEFELGGRITFASHAPEPALPFEIERTPAPEPPPVLEPDASAEPEELALPIDPIDPMDSIEPVEPTPAEATFPWHQPETAAEDEEEVAFWPSPRTSDPLPAVSPDDLTIIQDIEQELVGAAAAAAAPVAVADEPPPSRTPWRVMVIGCLVGLAAVGLWAYQSGMIRLEPPPPRPSSTAIKEAPAEPSTVKPAAETPAPPSNSAPAPAPVPEGEATTAAGGSGPGAAESAAQPKSETTTQSAKLGSSAAKGTVSTSGMGLDTALGRQTVTPAPGKTAVQVPRTTTPETRSSTPPPGTTAQPAPAATGAKPAPSPTAPAPAASTPTTDVRLVGDTPAGYGVHVSSFKTDSIAQNDLARFRALGYPCIVVSVEVPGRGIWRRVVLGPYDSPSEAEAMAAAVRAAGLSEKAQAMRLKP